MSNSQPVFFTSNTERRPKFMLETRIRENNDVFTVEKRPAVGAAKDHLANMVEIYKKLSKTKGLTNLVGVVEPFKTSKKGLSFNYIDGTSAERTLVEAVLREDWSTSQEIIDKAFAVIDALPQITKKPTINSEYSKFFGKAYNESLLCVEPGIVDLNLDNIIIDEGENWHLYDYEWVFDFPVPKHFLRSRLLWYFFFRHRETLRHHSQRIESVSLNNSIFVPAILYNKYETDFLSFADLQKAELNFQQFVTGNKDIRLPFLDNQTVSVKVVDTGQRVLGVDAVIDKAIKEKLKAEQQQRVKIEKQLESILYSRTYRFAKMLSSLKQKMHSALIRKD